ncbi:MAG: hypothetical protein AVDCRST_MAG01-01-395, partial [uncultured Rubrobacteraceae bacterium]
DATADGWAGGPGASCPGAAVLTQRPLRNRGRGGARPEAGRFRPGRGRSLHTFSGGAFV